MTQDQVAQLADSIQRAVLAVPGVVQMHGGAYGEVGTYLPGRKVEGVRVTSEATEVHVVLAADTSLMDTAAAVRLVVAPLVPNRVDVFVDDVQ